MKTKLLCAASILLLAAAMPVQAQAVFKCKTADGKTVIQDYSCGGVGTKTEDERAVRQIT
jgi:Skp family chaperone for outer membrane proteins